MNERLAVGIAAGLVACLGMGTLAGLDAARHVNGIYTAPPAPRLRPIAEVMPGSSPADWDQAPVAAVPVRGWAEQAAASEHAFFDPGASDRRYLEELRPTREERALLGMDADGEPIPVRVHRATIHRKREVPPPDDLQPPTDKAVPEVDVPKEAPEETPPAAAPIYAATTG